MTPHQAPGGGKRHLPRESARAANRSDDACGFAAPRRTVPWQHPRRGQVGEAIERPERLRRLVGEGSGLRTLPPGEHVLSGESVADEDGLRDRDVHGDTPRRVARHADDDRGTREVQDLSVSDLDHFVHVTSAQRVLAQAVREEAQHGTDTGRADLGLRLLSCAHPMRVGGVDEHGHTGLAQPLGEADVITVAVRQDEPTDVVDTLSERLQFTLQVVPMTGEARIDEGDSLRQINEIGGDDVVAQAMQMRRELRGESLSEVCDV